jgi:type II secretion system (T2SS) protein E
MTDPLNLQLIDTISFLTGYIIEPVFAKEEDLKWNIKYYYNKARAHLKKQIAVNSFL